jgi:hypothetical protein
MSQRLVIALSLMWLVLGFGLKYDDDGAHTHLGDKPTRTIG